MRPAPTPDAQPGWQWELKQIIGLAAPLAAAQLAQMIMAMTDAVMMGRISTDALAAGGLGSTVAMMMIVMAQGLVQSIQPIVAQGRGAGDQSCFGRTLAAGFIAATVSAVPIILVLLRIDRLLIGIGEPPAVSRLTLQYELAFAWGVPASLWQGVLRNYLAALARTRMIMIVSAGACGINLLLNWVLIFGHLGFPALGLAGSGYATATVWWGMGLVLALYVRGAELLPSDLFGLSVREIGRGLREVTQLGWPIAAVWAVEVGMFSGSSLAMGRFGPVALAAHQICLSLCSLVFMVPLAIATATSVRVGYYVGAGHPEGARRSGFAALGLGVALMSLSAVFLGLFARPIFGIYLDSDDPLLPSVTALGRNLLLAAAFQVFDGTQTIAAGALRGLKDTRAALIAGLVGYWLLGMPVGIGLAFWRGMGPVGIWWGFVASLVAVAILLSLRFRYRTEQMIRDRPSAARLAA